MTSSPLSQASAVTVDCASESCALAEAAPASEAAVVAPLYTSSRLHKRMMPIWQLAATYLQGTCPGLQCGHMLPQAMGAGVQQQARSYRRGSASQSCSSCSRCGPEAGSMLGTGSTLCTDMRWLPVAGHLSRARQPSAEASSLTALTWRLPGRVPAGLAPWAAPARAGRTTSVPPTLGWSHLQTRWQTGRCRHCHRPGTAGMQQDRP